MTKTEEAYITLLNTLGSDIEPPEIQEIVDHYHANADPRFAEELKLRKVRFMVEAAAVEVVVR